MLNKIKIKLELRYIYVYKNMYVWASFVYELV